MVNIFMDSGIMGLLKTAKPPTEELGNTMVTDRRKWLLKNLFKMATEEFGNVGTEELGIKSLQKNLEYKGYRYSIKMFAEETGNIIVTEKLRNTVVTGLGSKRLQKNWEQNRYKRTKNIMIKEYVRQKKVREELGTKILCKPS